MTDTQDTNPIAAVAEAILLLTYGELIEIGVQLRDMHSDSPINLNEHSAWAEMLHNWAEGQEHDHD